MGGGDNVITISANLATEGFKRGSMELERAIRGVTATAKNLMRTLIGIGSAYQILSRAVNAYMAENQKLSAQLSSIWTAFGNLLGPIINQLINWVTTAISYLLSFLRLLGVTAKTASELSKKANAAGGSLAKTIAGFDELNLLNAGGGGGVNGQLSDVEPEKWMEELAQLLKNKMWDEAADIIIAKLNEGLAKIRNYLNTFGEKIGEYLGGIIHIIARVINEVNWRDIGAGVAELLNNAFANVDGRDLGAILVGKFTIAFRVLMGFLETYDFGQLAKILSGIFIGAFDSMSSAIASADFKKIGENIRKFFENIDWEGIKESIFNFLKTAWNGALDLLWGLIAGDTEEEPPIVGSLRKLGEAIGGLVEAIQRHKPEVQGFIDWLVDTGIPKAIDDITETIKDLIEILNGDMGLSEFVGGMTGVEKVLALLAGIKLTTTITNLGKLVTKISDIGSKAPSAASGLGLFTSNLEMFGVVAGAAILALIGTEDQARMATYELGTAMGDSGDEVRDLAQAYDTLQTSIFDINTPAELTAAQIKAQDEALEQLSQILGVSVDELQNQYNAMGENKSMVELLSGYYTTLTEESDNLSASAAETAQKIAEENSVIESSAENAGKAIGSIKDIVNNKFSPIKETVSRVSTDVKKNITDSFGGAKATVESEVAEMDKIVESGFNNINESVSNKTENINNTSTNKWNSISGKISESVKNISKNVNDNFKSMTNESSNSFGDLSTKVQQKTEEMKSSVSTKFNNIKTGVLDSSRILSIMTIAQFEEMGKSVQTSAEVTKALVVSSFTDMRVKLVSESDSAAQKVKAAFATMLSGVTNAVSSINARIESIRSAVSGIGPSIAVTFQNLSANAWYWGMDMITNFANGVVYRSWAVYDSVRNVAFGIKQILGFSEPEKGPLSDFHTYAPDMMDSYAKGIESNKNKVLYAVGDVAKDISETMEQEYSAGPFSLDGIDASMDRFADKIVDGFNDLIERLQSITDNVMFTMPAVAGGGVVPYGIGGVTYGFGESSGSSELINAVEQLQELVSDFRYSVENMRWVAQFGDVRAFVEQVTTIQNQIKRQGGR